MTAASEYGKALFLLAREDGKYAEYITDLSIMISAFKENGKYVNLLDTPALSKKEKLSLIDEAFSSLNENIVNLLKILCERQSVHLIFEVEKSFMSLYNEEMGIEEVTAVTAVAMTEIQTSRLKEKLEKITGKSIIIKNVVDSSILGGVKLRYSGKQIDGSIKSRLDEFERKIKSTVIR